LVSLDKELDYIENYLELQKLRCDKTTKIKYLITGELDSHQIVPFLLIPFIENSFKHGGMNQNDKNIIDLSVKIDEESLEMHLKNSIPISVGSEIDGIGGFGIENVKSRLQSFYQDRYSLDLSKNEVEFTVKLKLNLK